ncbi:MAG: phosphotransferase [Patescibacteria group bacterium]
MRQDPNQTIAQAIALRYGVVVHDISRISRGVINQNYRVRTDKGMFLWKVYSLRTPKQVTYELAILRTLRAKNFHCPEVVQDLQGHAQGVWDDRPCVLLHYIPGKPLAYATAVQLNRMGQFLGAMHTTLQGVTLPRVARDRWEYAEVRRMLFEHGEEIVRKGFPGGEAVVAFMQSEFAKLPSQKQLPCGVTHQDVKPENVIVDAKGKLHYLDFDNAYEGVLLNDVATTIIWTCFPKGKLDVALLRAIVRGYERSRLLTEEERAAFETTLKFRLLREAFAWPYRFSPEDAMKNHTQFIKAYRDLCHYSVIQKRLWK